MVFSAYNEQSFEYRTHNTERKILDLDGIKVMMKPF